MQELPLIAWYGGALALALAPGIFFLALSLLRKKFPPIDGWAERVDPSPFFTRHKTASAASAFSDGSKPLSERYRGLFDYFLAGILEFRTEQGERVYYTGHKSIHGHKIEGLEGFARSTPLLAAWLASGRSATVADPRHADQTVDLTDLIRTGLLAGTDRDAPTYWGDIGHMDQRTVEAADIALVVWLTRDLIWQRLDQRERNRIAAWLRGVTDKDISPNNWLLFRVTILEVLAALGVEADATISRKDYAAFKKDYLEEGWFFDKPKGVDYYNAWAISYSLHWIDLINPDLDHDFIDDVLKKSARTTLHLISPNGVPLMGRSACYRIAVPSPVVIGYMRGAPDIGAGAASRALDAVWTHYVSNAALEQGRVSQGIYGHDVRLLDRYSGPASCLWSLRSLVLAFILPDANPFWTAAPEPLPVETADYKLLYKTLGWTVEGNRTTQEITVGIVANAGKPAVKLQRYTWVHRLVGEIFQRPYQPLNDHAKYGQPVYSTHRPYGADWKQTMDGKER